MSERLRYPEWAPEGVAPMRGLEHYLNATIALPAVLLELVRLRASLLNGCNFCIGHHKRELAKHNEPDTRIAALADWAGSDAFTPRERAALAWTDTITNIQDGHAPDDQYAAVSVFFEGKDLVDLTLAIASINAWNRMSIAFATSWDPGKAGSQQAKNAGKEGAPDAAGTASGMAQPTTQPTTHPTTKATPPPTGTAGSPRQTTPAHEDAPTAEVIDDDGGKVAQD